MNSKFRVIGIADAGASESYLREFGATHVLWNVANDFAFGYVRELPDGTFEGSVISHVPIVGTWPDLLSAAQGTFEAAEDYLDGIS